MKNDKCKETPTNEEFFDPVITNIKAFERDVDTVEWCRETLSRVEAERNAIFDRYDTVFGEELDEFQRNTEFKPATRQLCVVYPNVKFSHWYPVNKEMKIAKGEDVDVWYVLYRKTARTISEFLFDPKTGYDEAQMLIKFVSKLN